MDVPMRPERSRYMVSRRNFSSRNGFRSRGTRFRRSRVPRPMKSTSYDGVYYAKIIASVTMTFD